MVVNRKSEIPQLVLSFSTRLNKANTLFSDVNISQGSVTTSLRCGGIISSECNNERILEIGKNWSIFGEVMGKSWCLVFLRRGILLHFELMSYKAT